MTSFVLKIIACITMFIDHLGYVVYGTSSNFNIVGRLAFPIFAFLIGQGYKHTNDVKKYLLRLFIFGLIAQIPYSFFHSLVSSNFSLNIFFTLTMGLLAIYVFDKSKNKILGFLLVGLISCIPQITYMDYGYWGVLVIFFFYLFSDNKILMGIGFFGLVIIKYAQGLVTSNYHIIYILHTLGTFAAIIPILLYNKKQGKKIKYFWYIFYPVHLIILLILNYFFF